MRTFLTLFIILLFSSCSKTPEEKTSEAIDLALTHLSAGDCEDALKVLQDAGYQNSNGLYLQVLASAHACKASFNEISFVSVDLAAINTTSSNTILKTISIMSTSTETEADSVPFTSILSGINVLLNSTTGKPSQTSRNDKFGTRRGGDIGVQALILNFVNLGKFLHFYGSVNAAGLKGGQPGSNTCFLNYSDPRAQLITGIGTGSCLTDNDGHPDLDVGTDDGKRRVCEGLMLVTNVLDILNSLDLSASSSLNKFETISNQVNSLKTVAVAAGLGTLINMTSQSECEDYLSVPAQLLDMEYLYALIFEKGLL